MAEVLPRESLGSAPSHGRFQRRERHRELVRDRIADSAAATMTLGERPLVDQIGRFADLVVESLAGGGKVLFFGNGGSAADASHLAAELLGRYLLEREALPALSLTDNVSALSAVANDYAYADVFARQVRGLGQPGDVAVGISTSGGSENVIRGLQAAIEGDLRTVAMTGANGGAMRAVSELCLAVPVATTARIQECHVVIGHTVCEIVERAFAEP